MLLWNYSIIHKSPWKFFGGNTVSNVPANFNKNGQLRAIYSNETVPNQWWLPVGYYSGWMLPRTSGYIVAYSENQLSSSANPVMGINSDWVCNITTIAIANLSLVVSSNWVCDISLSSTWELIGSLSANWTSGITFTASWVMGANAFATWVSSIILNANAVISAIGIMNWSMNPFTELSPEWLANAVWNNPTRTLTSWGGWGGWGATPEEIWEYANRTLTSGEAPSIADIWEAQISDHDWVAWSFANKFSQYGWVSHVIDRSKFDEESKLEIEKIRKEFRSTAEKIKEAVSNIKPPQVISEWKTTVIKYNDKEQKFIQEFITETIPLLADKIDNLIPLMKSYEELLLDYEKKEEEYIQALEDIINNN